MYVVQEHLELLYTVLVFTFLLLDVLCINCVLLNGYPVQIMTNAEQCVAIIFWIVTTNIFMSNSMLYH